MSFTQQAPNHASPYRIERICETAICKFLVDVVCGGAGKYRHVGAMADPQELPVQWRPVAAAASILRHFRKGLGFPCLLNRDYYQSWLGGRLGYGTTVSRAKMRFGATIVFRHCRKSWDEVSTRLVTPRDDTREGTDMNIALINTNRIKPAIAPIGLDYVAETVSAAGHSVEILDLCWADDWQAEVNEFFRRSSFGVVGLTLRNTHDCAGGSPQSFLPEFCAITATVRNCTDALLVVGGVGFSIIPEAVLDNCAADVGVWADGEFALVELADRISRKQDWSDVPNLVLRREGHWRRNAPVDRSLVDLPRMTRKWVNNRRYFREGGQAGIETKRGCPCPCIYCADPVAKGKSVRTRPPQAVADELECLLQHGIDHIHTCDSEFNQPEPHAVEVCAEILRRGLGERLRWYAYCAPVPFSRRLARLMRRAGCVGINFGVDSGDEQMLRLLRRDFTPEAIIEAVATCREVGIACMLDLLLGAPGETRASLCQTIALMKRAAPDRVGVALGVAVIPGTELADMVRRDARLQAGLVGNGDVSEPHGFIDPEVAPFARELLHELIRDDERFLFFDPSRPDRNCNYNANDLLVDAIKRGHRGAYWDILRKVSVS